MTEPLRVSQITKPISPATITEAPYYSSTPEDMQRWFNTTVEYLQTQRGRSVEADSFNCLYKAPDGNRCAVGFHIPEDYITQLTGNSNGVPARSLVKQHPKLRGIAFPEGQEDFAGEIQAVHDRSIHRDDRTNRLNAEGREALRRIAKKYDLSDERIGF